MKTATLTSVVLLLAGKTFATHYLFTACNGGCTGTGCTRDATTFEGDTPWSLDIPGTQCIIFPAGGVPGSYEICNGGGKCTPSANVQCFASEDASERSICNAGGTQHINIFS